MKREDLKAKLAEMEKEIHKITRLNGVMYSSALYAYLNMAEMALAFAKLNSKDYDEEKEKDDE